MCFTFVVAEQVKLIILSLRWILFRHFFFFPSQFALRQATRAQGHLTCPLTHLLSPTSCQLLPTPISYQLLTIAYYLWYSAQQGVEDSCRLTCKTYVWINVLTVAVTEFRLGSSVSGQAIYWFWAALLGGSICHLQDVLWLLHSGDGMRGVLFL